MTLYLHIGYGKTATTSIQAFFRKNKEQLMVQGVLWAEHIWQEYNPKNNKPTPMVYGTASLPWYIAHSMVADLKNHKRLPSVSSFYKNIIESTKVDVENFFLQLTQQNANYDKIILSSEDFTCFPYALFFPKILPKEDFVELRDKFIARVKEHLAGFDDIKIVVGLRRQDKYIESAYNQVVASGLCYSDTIDNYTKLHACALDYADNLNAWAKYFGHKNILVMPFEKGAMPQGPVQAFIDTIGCKFDLSNFKDTDIYCNYSASPEILRDKIYYNRFIKKYYISFIKKALPKCRPDKVQTFFDTMIEVQKQSSVLLLTEEERTIILNTYVQSNTETARMFLNSSAGTLFHDGIGASAQHDLPFIHNKTLPEQCSASFEKILKDNLITKKELLIAHLPRAVTKCLVAIKGLLCSLRLISRAS